MHRSSGNVGRLTNSEIVEILKRFSLICIPLSPRVSSPMSSKNLVAHLSSRALGGVFFFSFALVASLFHADVGRCDLVLGNLAGSTNDNGTAAGFGSGVGYSIGFTVGSTSVTLTSVDLRLRSNTSSGLATLELRRDNNNNPESGSLALFGNQTVTNGFSTISFTPTATMQLTAGSKYWLTIGTQLAPPDGLLIGSDDQSIPFAGTFATFNGLRSGLFDNQTTVIPSGANTPTFAINGTITAVPEPSSFVTFALGCGIFEWYRRRSMRSRSLGA